MKTIFAVAALVLVFLLAACATPVLMTAPVAAIPQATAVPATAMAQPTAAVVSTFPTGMFQLKDTPSRGLQFNKDGTYFVLADGNHVVEGTYSAKGDVYTEESNNAKYPVPMQFKYTFDGANLKFQPVADPAKDTCDGRKGDFNDSKTWVLKP